MATRIMEEIRPFHCMMHRLLRAAVCCLKCAVEELNAALPSQVRGGISLANLSEVLLCFLCSAWSRGAEGQQ